LRCYKKPGSKTHPEREPKKVPYESFKKGNYRAREKKALGKKRGESSVRKRGTLLPFIGKKRRGIAASRTVGKGMIEAGRGSCFAKKGPLISGGGGGAT